MEKDSCWPHKTLGSSFRNTKWSALECIVDSDITTAICFLTGICSGAICVIVMAPWTWSVHSDFTATVSLLAFFIGYLMTRIAMALPQVCVSCYYVCYAEVNFPKWIELLIRIREGLKLESR